MKGRKRKPGARYPNGDLKPQGEPIVPAVWGRMRSEAAKFFDNPKLISEIGRLSFNREITDQQAATAFRIAETYSNFERAKEVSRSARSPNYERGFGRSGDSDELVTRGDVDKESRDLPNMDDLPDGDPLKKKMKAAIAAHETFWVLQAELTHLTTAQRHMIEALCTEDRHLSRDELVTVRELLDWLADRIGKSASKRKAKRAERNTKLLRPKAKPDAAPSRVTPKAKPSDHAALRAIMQKMRPELNSHALEQVCATFDLLREREKHREKLKPERVVSPDSQSGLVQVKLDRPTLSAPTGSKENDQCRS